MRVHATTVAIRDRARAIALGLLQSVRERGVLREDASRVVAKPRVFAAKAEVVGRERVRRR